MEELSLWSKSARTAADASVALSGVEGLRRPHTLALPVRSLLWGAGLVVALCFCLQWGASTGVNNDFTQNVWLPSHLLLDSANPYDPSPGQVQSALGTYGAGWTMFNSGKYYHDIYPAWVALLLAPFGAMPLAFATALWRAANLLLLVWGVGSMLRASKLTFRSTRFAVLLPSVLTVALCLIYRPSVQTLFLGQFSIIEFILLAVVWVRLHSSGALIGRHQVQADILTSLCMAVLATKPQATGLVVVLLGLWALSRGRWAIPASALISLFVLLLVPCLLYPASLGDWLAIVCGGQATSQAKYSVSLWGMSYHWLGSWLTWWAAVAFGLTMLGIAALLPYWRRDMSDKTSPVPLSLPLTVCMTCIVSPYMLAYEHVILLLPALVMLAVSSFPNKGAAAKKERVLRLAMYIWLAVLPFVVLLLQILSDKEYLLIIQSASLLAICWAAGLRWRPVGVGRHVLYIGDRW